MIEYLAIPYLAATSRLHGSAFPTPKWLEAGLYAIPYGLAVGWWYGVPAALCVALVKNTSHHDGFEGLGRIARLTPIAMFIAKPFGIERDSKAYDAIFWAVKGGLMALVPAVLCASPAMFLASAIGYPLAYWLHYNVLSRITTRVQWCEWLGGAFAGVGFIF